MPSSRPVHALTDVAYGDHPRQRLDVFCPEAGLDRPVTVCFHGGWWQAGRREDLRPLCLHLAELGLPAATVGLRPIGEPGVADGMALVDDAVAGIRRAMEDASLLGAHPRLCHLLGCGSGAVTALIAARRACLRHDPRIVSLIAVAPTSTLTPWEGCDPGVARGLASFAGTHLTDLDPTGQISAELPPTLVLHGDADTQVPARLAHDLFRRLREAEVPAKLAVLCSPGHRMIEDPFAPTAHSALERIRDWLTQPDHGE